MRDGGSSWAHTTTVAAAVVPSGAAGYAPGMADPALTCPPCPTLPSSTTAYAVWQGAPGWPLLVARDIAVRGVIIAAGAWLAGIQRPLKAGLAGAVAIEVFVLGWVRATTPRI